MGSQTLDHSFGDAFRYQGVIYYSPNSSRRFSVPTKPISMDYNFKPVVDNYADYLETGWIDSPFGYLAFIPLEPHLSGPLFSCLQDSEIRIAPSEDGKYWLEPSVESKWLELESRLVTVIRFLDSETTYYAFRPPLPSMLNYNKSYFQSSWAVKQARRVRDWFLIWIGVAAFYVALNDDPTRPFEDIPSWYSRFLQTHPQFPQSWLSDFRAFIFDFLVTKPFQCVGGILDPFVRYYMLPPVDWFYKWNIPIWYRWSQTEANLLLYWRSSFGYLEPPIHILEKATAFIPCKPSPPPRPSSIQAEDESSLLQEDEVVNSQRADVELARMRNTHIKSKPWKNFFNLRATAHNSYLQTETPQQKTTRLNRERKPPTASAEVYLWDWSSEDQSKLVRTRVPKRERERTLFNSFLRRHYDPRLNVWEVCRYFDFAERCPGGGHDGYDEDEDEDEDDLPSFDPAASPPHVQPSSEEIIEQVKTYEASRLLELPLPLPRAEVVSTELNLLESQPVDVPFYLSLFYGFLWPLPYPTTNITVNITLWKEIMRNVGLRSTTPPHPTMPAAILAFLQGLSSKKPEDRPPNDLFDLTLTSRAPIDKLAIQSQIPKVGNLFIIQPHMYQQEVSFCDWAIALTSAADAARAFRLLSTDDHHSTISLSMQLVNVGITFHTLRRLSIPPTVSLSSPPTLIPVRVRDHVFTVDDHSAYVERRAHILSSPRGRAALLRGGLVWRLALEHLGLESVSFGPSSAAVQHGLGHVFKAPDGQIYIDDDLTQNELEVICGLYRCHTGMVILFSYTLSHFKRI